MPSRSPPKDLSLKALELFHLSAEKGSLQAAAQETGLAISTVSHHLRNLEDHLGVALFNHSRKPLVLTPKGRAFLENIDPALVLLRRARAEAAAGDPTEARALRLGTVEDFDSDIIPDLAVYLAETMPRCALSFHTDTSHRLIEMLENQHLDLGVSTIPSDGVTGLRVRPLLKDPFVLLLPAGTTAPVKDVIEGRTALPLLRFAGNQIIARQIDAQLRRLGISAPPGFECSNSQTLMAMVAAGAGWAISTPLLYARGRRFHAAVEMQAFPGKSFARQIALLITPDCAAAVVDLVDAKMRALITGHAIAPLSTRAPWLEAQFTLMEQA